LKENALNSPFIIFGFRHRLLVHAGEDVPTPSVQSAEVPLRVVAGDDPPPVAMETASGASNEQQSDPGVVNEGADDNEAKNEGDDGLVAKTLKCDEWVFFNFDL
jgi:hypothetical protein